MSSEELNSNDGENWGSEEWDKYDRQCLKKYGRQGRPGEVHFGWQRRKSKGQKGLRIWVCRDCQKKNKEEYSEHGLCSLCGWNCGCMQDEEHQCRLCMNPDLAAYRSKFIRARNQARRRRKRNAKLVRALLHPEFAEPIIAKLLCLEEVLKKQSTEVDN